MEDMNWLMYANIAVWLGIALYVGILARIQTKLKQRINQMEQMRNE